MRELLRRCAVCLFVFSLVIVGGCQKEEAPQDKKEEVALVKNSVYDAPSNPTAEQIKVYNELSQAMNNNAAADKIAELVAVNFAYEFFSLYQKSGKDDIGGLTFIPEAEREAFTSYAKIHYYNNYATVISQYSKEDLPNVILHEVNSTEVALIDYGQMSYDGYEVSLTLKYADSKLPAEGLKTSMRIQVINNNGIYQVVAVED